MGGKMMSNRTDASNLSGMPDTSTGLKRATKTAGDILDDEIKKLESVRLQQHK